MSARGSHRPQRPAASALALAIGAVALAACAGYADLPLALRESGTLRVTRVDRFSEGPGQIELALDMPTDAAGPYVVVGHPDLAAGGYVQAWAFGTCRGSPAPVDAAMRVCLVVSWDRGVALSEPAVASIVVESRGDGRRLTLVGIEPEVPGAPLTGGAQ
jgi:hypothetical protein